MADRGFKAGLEAALAEARQQELQRETGQTDLFGLDPGSVAPGSECGGSATGNAPFPVANGLQRNGRQFGSRNKRTDAAARFYMSRFGDPLARGVEIAALPILADGVLQELSKILGMERSDAAKWWLGVYNATLPFTHQRLSTLTVRPEGAPDGEAVSWTFSDDQQVLDAITGTSDLEVKELEEVDG